MTSRAIELLVDECAFDPRMLQIKFPTGALAACELPAMCFFQMLEDTPNLSALSLLDGRWRADRISQDAYDLAGPEGRVEINAIICGMRHEMSHRVDLLITPFGVQYLTAAVEEYLLLQEFVPQALDREGLWSLKPQHHFNQLFLRQMLQITPIHTQWIHQIDRRARG